MGVTQGSDSQGSQVALEKQSEAFRFSEASLAADPVTDVRHGKEGITLKITAALNLLNGQKGVTDPHSTRGSWEEWNQHGGRSE